MKKIKNIWKHKRLLFEMILVIIILNNQIIIKHLEKQKIVYGEVNNNEVDDLQSENETLKTFLDASQSENEALKISLDNLQSENEVLKTSLDNLQSENEVLKLQKFQKNEDYKTLFNDIFWDIGKYIPKEEAIFYTSPLCSKKAKPAYFLSTRWINYDRDNSYITYAYSSNIGIVWSIEEIHFEKIKNQ